ncbi:MAG: hypothetical protein ACK4S2_02820 [Gemmobacter sp.]|uniref:hypothetical protein n=1 Tax=Gemmobacter sp. TaxID=1898957 RepID=UPI00391B6893
MPTEARQGLVLAAAVIEMMWIDGAALGVASDFHPGTPPLQALCAAMGLVASVLTALTLVKGLAIWRNQAVLTPALRDGMGLGLVLTFGLTMVAAWGMAAGPGHLVGVPASGARVPLMGWSREVGDLRFAPFLATHALHVVPLAGSRAAVWLAGGGLCRPCAVGLCAGVVGPAVACVTFPFALGRARTRAIKGACRCRWTRPLPPPKPKPGSLRGGRRRTPLPQGQPGGATTAIAS